MKRWLKQNLSIAVIFTLLSAMAMGIAYAAIQYSDTQNLKIDVQKLKDQVNNLPGDIASIKATLSATNEDVKFIKNYMIK